MAAMSYVHIMHHLMVITLASQAQVKLIIVSLKKVERMHLLTRKDISSQLLSLKYGQSKKL
jgi:hypothetical protein